MEAFSEILSQYPQIMYGGAGATACVFGTLIYKIATRKKPSHVNVNCWFCNQDTVVPYGNRNCWDCPNCEQYNGFQENGDYNKPIPAQYSEHLNHGVSPGFSLHESPRRPQWANCPTLLCKKCNNSQTLKIRQLSSFMPRDDDKYDEEIEVYRHHLEQTYKLCRPCQATVEYYIKHQNRQLRAVLFNPQLRRGRDTEKAFVKNTFSFSTPVRVILFRLLAFLTSAFMVAVGVYGSTRGPPASSSAPQPHGDGAGGSGSAPYNDTAPPLGNASGVGGGGGVVGPAWDDLLALVPDEVLENARLVLLFGRAHQTGVVSLGLLTCVTSILLAGPVRLRRIDAVASMLWFLLLTLYLLESYLKTDFAGWLETVKFSTSSVCCLVGFAAAVATRRSSGQRRARGRRYLSGSSLGSFYGGQAPPPLSPSLSDPSAFAPTPPPNLSHLLSRQLNHRARKPSPCSLPGRLNRALSLGTIPSLARTDSGYLFSGSRPSSQCKDSPPSDYFSLKSVSRPSSPGPSPAPSVAGSVTSTSSSARQRRPLISPARLQLGGRKLQLFPSHPDPPVLAPPPCPSEHTNFYTAGVHPPEGSPFSSPNHDLSSLLEDSSVFEDVAEEKKRGSTSTSSACLVDTTTGAGVEGPKWKGVLGWSLWPGLLCVSLSANLIFGALYTYGTWS
ncbi:transmembrane protein 201-like isoform X1 [Anguilla anguilla]|uniref:transmembrane protein 201-like isoform X1 n=1 Tax=Anguilla anguilla TaxID=7936 RepID=UPI0015AC2094|nr:transmembrane protein 201-like isoform X1 [Anguilla anguilla]